MKHNKIEFKKVKPGAWNDFHCTKNEIKKVIPGAWNDFHYT